MDEIAESTSTTEPTSFNIADELQKKSLLKTNLFDEINALTSSNVLAQFSIVIEEIKGDNIVNDEFSIGLIPSDEKSVFPPTKSFLSKGIRDEISMFVTSYAVDFSVEASTDEKAFSNTLSCSEMAEIDKQDIVLDLIQDTDESNTISIHLKMTKTLISSVLQKKNADLKSLEIEVDELSLKMREAGKKISDKSTAKGKKGKVGKVTNKSKKSSAASSQQVTESANANESTWWHSASEAVIGAAVNSFVVVLEFRGYGCFVLASYLIYKYGDQISV